eukprot:TRINITY_DN69993_c0_g1_i1.p1 TRINITY_DN69993_c0_g1~~TRINITY_DN69993_c0_g1_i1.p1  ORF type:complete len:336 (+),score=52.42 TRINITY_DN69993_c0_g1_i1:91-1008(+)
MALAGAGGLIAGGASLKTTRVVKDWECASQMDSRRLRMLHHQRARSRTMTERPFTPTTQGEDFYAKPFILTRAVMTPELRGLGDAPFDDLEKRAREVFTELDVGRIGLITMDALEESFARVHSNAPSLRMSNELFRKYVGEVLPHDCEGVDLEQFKEFHRRIWENQPLAVRRSSKTGVAELYNSEIMARKAYNRYGKGFEGYIDQEDLPNILADLGLQLDRTDRDWIDKFYEDEFVRADTSQGDRISIHDFVRFKNLVIERSEAVQKQTLAKRGLQRSASTPTVSSQMAKPTTPTMLRSRRQPQS